MDGFISRGVFALNQCTYPLNFKCPSILNSITYLQFCDLQLTTLIWYTQPWLVSRDHVMSHYCQCSITLDYILICNNRIDPLCDFSRINKVLPQYRIRLYLIYTRVYIRFLPLHLCPSNAPLWRVVRPWYPVLWLRPLIRHDLLIAFLRPFHKTATDLTLLPFSVVEPPRPLPAQPSYHHGHDPLRCRVVYYTRMNHLPLSI